MTVFAPPKTNILSAVVIALVILLVVGSGPAYLYLAFLIPLALVMWTVRSRTEVADSGISLHYALRPSVTVPWEKIQGVSFKGSRALLKTSDNHLHSMPGVSFNSLPELAAASQGRIPDALTAGQEAANEKVVLIERDGRRIMLTEEEYRAYQAEKQASKEDEGEKS